MAKVPTRRGIQAQGTSAGHLDSGRSDTEDPSCGFLSFVEPVERASDAPKLL